jgi:hypothetical protein
MTSRNKEQIILDVVKRLKKIKKINIEVVDTRYDGFYFKIKLNIHFLIIINDFFLNINQR